jgi:hypothetical protein
MIFFRICISPAALKWLHRNFIPLLYTLGKKPKGLLWLSASTNWKRQYTNMFRGQLRLHGRRIVFDVVGNTTEYNNSSSS